MPPTTHGSASALVVALCLAARPVAGQPLPAPQEHPALPAAGERSVGAWAGGARTSDAGHFIGATPGRGLALVGVRFGLMGGPIGPVTVEYVGHLIPAVYAYANPVQPLTTTCGTQQITVSERGRRSIRQVPGFCRRRVYGAGALPLGVQLAVPLGTHLRAFAAGNAGAVVFAENVPEPAARRFNVAFDFGGGVELGTRRSAAVTLGYKLHHISNAWTARSNPGVDHHVFYVGVVHRVRAARRSGVAPAAVASRWVEEKASRR